MKLQLNQSELPGTDTIDWDNNPPVHDSADVKYISFFWRSAPKSALRISRLFNSNLQSSVRTLEQKSDLCLDGGYWKIG